MDINQLVNRYGQGSIWLADPDFQLDVHGRFAPSRNARHFGATQGNINDMKHPLPFIEMDPFHSPKNAELINQSAWLHIFNAPVKSGYTAFMPFMQMKY